MKSKNIKANNDILLIFLLFVSASIKSNKIDNIKKTVCLFIEKYSSIEKESISPVMPNDKINIKFILSTDIHQFIKYFIIYSGFLLLVY